jgi:1-acyl-sn-glycerol-3-phosphate acyltransferase
MSETRPDAAPPRQVNESLPPEPFVLPLWVIDGIRPVLRAFSQLFWRVQYKGLENIPQSGGVIIASNHQTYLDPLWMGLPVKKRQVRYLAWSESFDWPIVGNMIEMLGAWPLQIDKTDPTAIRRTLQWLRNGGAMVIFPEGGRCLPDGKMLRFKPGAVRMALEANVPILPITIRGGHRVWPKGYRLPRFRKVELVYHPLQYPAPQEGEDQRQCARRETDRLAETIGSAL